MDFARVLIERKGAVLLNPAGRVYASKKHDVIDKSPASPSDFENASIYL